MSELYQMVPSELYLKNFSFELLTNTSQSTVLFRVRGATVSRSCQTLGPYPSGHGGAAGGFSHKLVSSMGNTFGQAGMRLADPLGGAA